MALNLTEEQINEARARLNISIPEVKKEAPDPSQSALDYLNKRKVVPQVEQPEFEEDLTTPLETSIPESTLGESARSRISEVKKSFGRTKRGEQHPLETSAQVVSQGLRFGGDLLFEGAKGLFNLIPKGFGAISSVISGDTEEDVRADLSIPFQKAIQTKTGQDALFALGQGFEAYERFKIKNPRKAANIEATLTFGDLLIGGFGAKKLLQETGKELVQKGIKEGVEEVVTLSKRQTKIADNISPKLTPRAKEIAIREKRVISPKETKLGGKKPDIIKPSQREIEISQTVDRLIPGANKLNQFKLADKMQEKVVQIATKLRDKFRNVSFTPQKATDIKTKWTTVKSKQADLPNFKSNEAVSKKAQDRFEIILDEMLKPVKDAKTGQFRQKNLDDLWQIAIDYDNADFIGTTVKNASDLSVPSLQIQKDMWLENRRLLREVLEDAAKNLDPQSERAFRDMARLYDGINNIAQKADIDTKGKAGLLKQILQSKATKAAGAIGGGGLILRELKK